MKMNESESEWVKMIYRQGREICDMQENGEWMRCLYIAYEWEIESEIEKREIFFTDGWVGEKKQSGKRRVGANESKRG